MNDVGDYNEWTSCEVHGHDFEDYDAEDGTVKRACCDCGEPSE